MISAPLPPSLSFPPPSPPPLSPTHTPPPPPPPPHNTKVQTGMRCFLVTSFVRTLTVGQPCGFGRKGWQLQWLWQRRRTTPHEGRHKRGGARAEEVAEGVRGGEEVQRTAETDSLPRRTLERTQEPLKRKKKKRKFNGTWCPPSVPGSEGPLAPKQGLMASSD